MPDWGGHWRVSRAAAGGLARDTLRHVLAHARLGGERFALSARGTPRSLKLQYQARAVPPWQRQGPLLSTATGQLVFVPGLGPEAAFAAPTGAPQLQLRWVADTSEPTGWRQPGG